MSIVKERIAASPVADWSEIALAFQPVRSPTEARIKTLRSHQAISPGVRVVARNGRRLTGSPNLYSSLNLCAAALLRGGFEKESVQAAKEGAELEALFKEAFKTAFSSRSLSDYRSLLFDLHGHTEPSWRKWLSVLGATETPGRWISVANGQARIEGTDGNLLEELPASAPSLRSSRVGDPVIVLWERLQSGTAISRIVPAIDLPADQPQSDWTTPLNAEDQNRADGARRELEQPVPDTQENREAIKHLLTQA